MPRDLLGFVQHSTAAEKFYARMDAASRKAAGKNRPITEKF